MRRLSIKSYLSTAPRETSCKNHPGQHKSEDVHHSATSGDSGPETNSKERLYIKTFGSDYDNLKTVDVVNLCLKNVDRDVTVTITAHVVPIICSPLNYQVVQFARKNHAHLKDIALSECVPEENLVVDILIGADQYWSIANGEVRRGESGPVAMNTRFGWT